MFQVQQLLKPSATKHPESLSVLVDGGTFTDEDMAYLPRCLEADSDLRKLDVALREQRIKGEPGKANASVLPPSHIAVGARLALPPPGLSLTTAVLFQRHHGSSTHGAAEPHSGLPLPPLSFPALGRRVC